MAKEVESYLVGLGFNADASKGKEFLETYKKIQEQMAQQDGLSDKSANKREQQQKKQLNTEKTQSADRLSHAKSLADDLTKTFSSLTSLDPIGAMFSAYKLYQTYKQITDFYTSITKAKKEQKAKKNQKTNQVEPDTSQKKASQVQKEPPVPPQQSVSPEKSTPKVESPAKEPTESTPQPGLVQSFVQEVNNEPPDELDTIIRQIQRDTERIERNTEKSSEKFGSNRESSLDEELGRSNSSGNSLNLNQNQDNVKDLFKGEGSEGEEVGEVGKIGGEVGEAGEAAEGASGLAEVGAGAAEGGVATAGAGAGAAEAGIVGAGAMGGPVGLAVAAGVVLAVEMAKAVKAAADFVVNMAKANTEVESIARSMWMTTSDAWQMTSTLQAMGKSTKDIAEIAANPTLRKQYETLSEFQEKYAKLPSDYQQVNDKWTQDVTTRANELKMSLGYTKQMLGYDLEKGLDKPLAKALEFVNNIVKGINKIIEFFSGDKDKDEDETEANGSNMSKSQAEQAMKNYNVNWASTIPDKNYYTPNASTTSTQNNTNVTHSPQTTVNVYANSSDPKSVGNAAGQAVEQANGQSQTSLLKQMQGVNR